MTLAAIALSAATATIEEGRVLHVRADRLPGRRSPKRAAMPAIDCTVGPDARGGFLVVNYSRVKSGEEARHETAEDAVGVVLGLLGENRLYAIRFALRRIYGEPERQPSRFAEDERLVARGAALRRAYGHRPDITGCMGGPAYGVHGIHGRGGRLARR